jgi:hypothetical protein
MQEIPLDIDPETWLALDLMAVERGCSAEQLVWTAIDQYILRETGQNN